MNSLQTQKKRIVITGVGPVTSAGVGITDFSKTLTEPRELSREINLFDVAHHASKRAFYITDFNVEKYLRSRKTYLDRSSEFALASANLAITDAGLEVKSLKELKAGLFLGTAFGSMETEHLFYRDVITKGPKFAKPILFPHAYPNTAISLLAIEYGLDGSHDNFASGMVSAGYAVMEAFDLLREGRLKIALVGGYDALSEPVLTGYEMVEMLSPGTSGIEKCAPCDVNRNGFILGEGAGMLVLEDAEFAMSRNAKIYAELAGVVASVVSDSSNKLNTELMIEAIQSFIDEVGINPAEIDLYLANANGSITLDLIEMQTLSKIMPDVPISTIKPITGETLGASAVLQVIAASNLIQTGIVPPILNLYKPDVEGLNYIQSRPCQRNIRLVVTSTIDPGGAITLFAIKSFSSSKHDM